MWPNQQIATDLVTFTEENLNGKLHFFVQYKVSSDLRPQGQQQNEYY